MYNELLKLVPANQRQIMADWWLFWQGGNQHFCCKYKDAELKEEKIRLLEKAMRRPCALSKNLLAKLQNSFVQENISISILLDLLVVWRYWAAENFPTSEQQFTDMCGYIAAPLARLIMALNNESPSTYLPMTALLSETLYSTEGVFPVIVTAKLKITSKQRKNKCAGWLKNAAVLLEIVSGKRLKMQLALLLNYRKLQLKYMMNNKQPSKSLLDEVAIFLYSFYQWMTIRKKTLHNKGI